MGELNLVNYYYYMIHKMTCTQDLPIIMHAGYPYHYARIIPLSLCAHNVLFHLLFHGL